MAVVGHDKAFTAPFCFSRGSPKQETKLWPVGKKPPLRPISGPGWASVGGKGRPVSNRCMCTSGLIHKIFDDPSPKQQRVHGTWHRQTKVDNGLELTREVRANNLPSFHPPFPLIIHGTDDVLAEGGTHCPSIGRPCKNVETKERCVSHEMYVTAWACGSS